MLTAFLYYLSIRQYIHISKERDKSDIESGENDRERVSEYLMREDS